ncbi:hypothetical protein FRC02_012034 [Tulasnella sp. 418]|nr:hypothetical protein FRC02_012034 [Tulasnella sp. 418]
MLLLWAPSVTPSAGVKLVTIRFSSAVYLESIRIVPRGVAPFSQEPLFIGETTPNSFRLKIYLNYQTSSDGKAKATNTLLTSSLLYSGELMEHQLNAEQQFSTRLMILEGDFERISVAIYGETAIPESNAGGPNELKYSPSILPSTSPSALPPSIDMSLTSNPSSLSKAIIDAMGSRQSLDDLIKIVLSDSRDQPRQAMDITEEPGASAPSTFSLPSVLPPSPPASSDDSTIYGSWTNDAFQALRARFGSKRDLGYEQSSDITASIYLGVASLLVVMVWISWEEPATKSGGMFERCLLIVRRWLSDPQHREVSNSPLDEYD